ncbi:MAG: SDR family NAD(P)-dependent oxidoreductase [Pyrinomonadaceae bacterium]|nr:SDR family NAD(P)-dependent oxidoreductase [Pyrinomonadaceae bacterium]
MSLDGKYALITGSSRGIGRGIAQKLAANHCRLVHYNQNEPAANVTLAAIRKLVSDGFLVQGDVSQPKEIEEIFRKVRPDRIQLGS